MPHRNSNPDPVNRRAFLRGGAAFAGGLLATSPFANLAAAVVRRALADDPAGDRTPRPDYGVLFPVRDENTGLPLLHLPAGFSYVSFGWTGDVRADGSVTPSRHDGMAALPAGKSTTRLIRNHEITSGLGNGGPVYDRQAGGGTTTLEFDTEKGRLHSDWPSLGGTVRNCAGGPTPWGSWLTCEETLIGLAEDHGFIFEVPAVGEASAIPLHAMGRFVHEAVAVDPGTGIVYETEDSAVAGFYRFVPKTYGRLEAGGRLQMLAVEGMPRFDTRTGQSAGVAYPVKWVDIDDPQRAHHHAAERDGAGVFTQGFDNGGAIFARLEGAWWGNKVAYFVSTSGGNAGEGQVWAYDPDGELLALVFESPGASVLDSPDNICVSPRGGIVLCEDGSGVEFLHGLTPDGRIFLFARNNVVLSGEKNGFFGDFTSQEFAGATFSPDGRWLFVNVQTPGITFAITGPWERGAL